MAQRAGNQKGTQSMDLDPLGQAAAVQQQWQTRQDGVQGPENASERKTDATLDASKSKQPDLKSGAGGVRMGDQPEAGTQVARGTGNGASASGWAQPQREEEAALPKDKKRAMNNYKKSLRPPGQSFAEKVEGSKHHHQQ